MKTICPLFSAASLIIGMFSSCTRDVGRRTPPPPVSCTDLNVTYTNDIQPIISTYCATPACHVNNGSAPGNYAQYSMVKFTVDAGLFQKRTFDDKDMPPVVVLPDSVMQKLKCWVNDGAPNN